MRSLRANVEANGLQAVVDKVGLIGPIGAGLRRVRIQAVPKVPS